MNPLGSFADDTKLLKAINSLLQNHQLQEYLDHVYHWSDLNNMFFNEDKFVHIHYSTDQNPPIYLKPSKSPILTKTSIKDLGVIIQNDLQYNQHIVQLVAKANKVSEWAQRTIRSRDTLSMKIILKQVIIVVLDYASIIWSPIAIYHFDLLQNVQKHYTSKFSIFSTLNPLTQTYYCNVPYSIRLKTLNLFMHKAVLNHTLLPTLQTSNNI